MFHTARSATIALVYITFIGSMVMANDMALITFLPLGYFVLSSTGNKKYMAFVFIMQNIAANLGGMITPFGNPQNLYMYSYFDIPTAEFVRIMALPFVLSVVLITACCFLVGDEELKIAESNYEKLNGKKAIVYGILFVFSIMIVFRVVPYYYGLVVVVASLLIMDPKAIKQVDYPLLLTFCAFFVFAGNMARIPFVNDFLQNLISHNTLLYGVLACQCISNVPSAILLSKFTTNYPELLVAVNIGGAGTLVSSLASLITFREYTRHAPDDTAKYIKQFSVYNFSILAFCS
jgi:Na+/H+ antiporter NhaD/arsenite permease-like protein